MSVQSIRPQLNEQDIHRLIKGETPEDRASVAHRLCRRIALDVLSDSEREYSRMMRRIWCGAPCLSRYETRRFCHERSP